MLIQRSVSLTILFLFLLACKKNNPATSTPSVTDEVDQLTTEQLQIMEAAGVDKISTFADALFADSMHMKDWQSANDKDHAYIFGRVKSFIASDKKALFISRMTNAACQLVDDKLHAYTDQPNGLAYVNNGKTFAASQIGYQSVCKNALYGLDCSGMIYQIAIASGVEIPSGGTIDYSKAAVWNTAFDKSADFKGLVMIDVGSSVTVDMMEPGDIVVQPSVHMGMIFKSAKQSSLEFFNSAGSLKYSCAINTDADHGPVIKPNVSKWLPLVFKTGYHVLRVSLTGNPGLTTSIFIGLTQTTVNVTGYIKEDGGSAITARGFCWSTHSDPTLADSVSVNGGGKGIFSGTINNLLNYPAYYVRAYATNSSGTSYGNEISFVPLADSIFTDDRDQQQYTFRHIGSQVWMTGNMNYFVSTLVKDTPVCRYYADNLVYAPTYGYLYTWQAANAAVPPGWHLPSGKEYATLYEYLMNVTHTDGYSVDEHLKDKILWEPYISKGTNLSGFSARPGGSGYPIKYKQPDEGMGHAGFWWTANENDYLAGYFGINDSQIIGGSDLIKLAFVSVRCIRD